MLGSSRNKCKQRIPGRCFGLKVRAGFPRCEHRLHSTSGKIQPMVEVPEVQLSHQKSSNHWNKSHLLNPTTGQTPVVKPNQWNRPNRTNSTQSTDESH